VEAMMTNPVKGEGENESCRDDLQVNVETWYSLTVTGEQHTKVKTSLMGFYLAACDVFSFRLLFLYSNKL
jgi:hypothetical protein